MGTGSSDDNNRRRKLQYNYDDYDYYGLDREATGFNISSSLYVDPYCFGCPDPQTLQIDSINPIGASLFGRRSLSNKDPMHVKRIPLQNQRRVNTDSTERIDFDINYSTDFGPSASSKQNAYDYYSEQTKSGSTTTSSSQTTKTTTTKTYTTTTSSTTVEKSSTTTSSNNQNDNIFIVSQVTEQQQPPSQEDIQITTTTTTTTTEIEGGTTSSTSSTVSPKDGLVYYLRSTMPEYFNQVDDAMAFSHPEVSLFDSLVCYINFSIVVQEVDKDYWFLTCDQYLYHQCSVIEEQCYPEGEIPCIGL